MNPVHVSTPRQPFSRMRPLLRAGASIGAVTLLGLFAFACGPTDPYLQIEKSRAQYEAQMQGGFYVDERVVEREPVLDSEGMEVSIEPDVEKDVLLDFLVKNGADQPLDGITVEVEHVDSTGELKQAHRIYVDVSSVGKGNVGQFSERLINVDYVDGDAFAVSIRTPVPEAERSAYREFDGVSP